jgi:N-acetylglutamate synthase-like GNAT family acetyltransferase
MNRDVLDRLEYMAMDIDVDYPTQQELTAIILNYVAAEIQPDSAATFMIARMNGLVVAQVMYKSFGDSMSIAGLWVSPSYRNTRAALGLICGLFHEAANLNVRHLHFDVDEQHSALYKRLGACKIRGGYEVTR